MSLNSSNRELNEKYSLLKKDNSQSNSDLAFKTCAKAISPATISRMLGIDFNEKVSDEHISVEDQKFLTKINEGMHKTRTD